MWDTYNEDKAPRADIGKIVRIAVFSAIMVIIFAMVSNQSVNFVMNVQEFGEVYSKPLYFMALSGVILASIALVRLNFGSRHSMTWYGIKMLINFLRRGEYESQNKMSRYTEFQMSNLGFALWQLTKVILFAPIFGNVMFGMATEYIIQGNNIDAESIGSIFTIPFADIPRDGSYTRQEVLPMLPALTILMPPVLASIGLRLLLYIGVSSTVNIVSQYAIDTKESKPKFLSYISTIEIVAGVAILWIGFNMFFSAVIDYNTRYGIIGSTTIGAAFLIYGFVDRRHARVIIYPTKRHLYSRLFTVVVVVGLAGSIMIVNILIAETRKDLNEPFVEQQIEVNRYLHGLDRIEIKEDDAGIQPIAASAIPSTVQQNSDILDNIRLWDEAGAKARLKQQLEQSDLGYFDFDLLRFNNKMYWTGTVMPLIPAGVAPKDAWLNQHFIYTHSEIGLKMFEANNGDFVDENQFFNQHLIYYGESAEPGVFTNYWSAHVAAGTRSEEVGGVTYNGSGGVEVAPPLSWMFEPNFMAYTSTPVNILRYKDIHDRMDLLYPYFVYDFCFDCTPSNPQPKKVEAFMVTDGAKTYWLMPLVAAINTSNVPWSSASSSGFMLKLVGYSLIDAYDGTVGIIVTGDDFFSKMFFEEYKGLGTTRDVPEWLADQIRYPEEMFIWQISKFNTYHVTDPKTFIETKDFYAIADDANELAPHYLFAKPPGFTEPEFVGLQSLELKEPKSTSLSGYMVVQNNLQNLGKMTFYSIPSNSTAKLIDPLAAKNTFKESEEFKEAKKSIGNSNPIFGELSLYRIGVYEVYFIPLFAEPGSKLDAVAAVGAASIEGTNRIGLGSTPTGAFENYLQKLSGIIPSEPGGIGNQTSADIMGRKHNLERAFADAGLSVIEPTSVSTPVEFKEAEAVYKEDVDFAQVKAAIHEFTSKFASQGGRIYEWQDGTTINFGVLREVDGIVENHYISIEVG